jgi:hypothetical protein
MVKVSGGEKHAITTQQNSIVRLFISLSADNQILTFDGSIRFRRSGKWKDNPI